MHPIKAIVQQKCPQCREGAVFQHYSYSPRFMKMHETCPFCGFRFEVEPGFFWGAMYISYAFTIAIAIPVGILLYLILGYLHVWTFVAVIGAVLFVLSPLIFRYSRIVMLHGFAPVQYDPKSKSQQ